MAEIASMPMRVCPKCMQIYIEDDRMYFDVNVCPHCGADVTASDGPSGAVGADDFSY